MEGSCDLVFLIHVFMIDRGKRCEVKATMCEMLEPCKNGGRCEGSPEFYKCFCPWGFIGRECENSELADGCV